MQPETWKAIADYTGRAWIAVGPLAGVLIGALLTRSWDKTKWERDNRKEECRELIKGISHAATLILKCRNVGVVSGEEEKQAYDAYLETLQTFHDRIFIAKKLEEEKILDSWAYAVGDFGARKIDAGAFSDRVEKVRKEIIGLVISK